MNKTHVTLDKKMSQLPSWLWTSSSTLPPMYRRVWEAVREERPGSGVAQGELLVDTNKVFPLLLTSQLPTEVLGYIWSLANQKYAGQLTEQELYIVLALVAVAQANYTFNGLDVLHLFAVPPIPNVNITLLEPRTVRATKFEHKSHASYTQEVGPRSALPDSRHAPRGKSLASFLTLDATGANNPSSDVRRVGEGKSDAKFSSDGGQFVNANVVSPDAKHISRTPVDGRTQYVASSSELNDEFSEFQSAPISSVPVVPMLDARIGSAIGSRLANHNLGVKKCNDKLKKTTTSKGAHGGNPLRNSVVGASSSGHCKDVPAAERLTELFPKCSVKSQAKTVVLKDTIIRNSNPSKDNNVGAKDATIFTEKVLPVLPTETESPIIHASVNTTILKRDVGDDPQDLMSIQPMEDKYSALRILVEAAPEQSTQPKLFSDATSPAADDFGDFVSAEQPNSVTVNSSNSGSSVDFFAEFEFKQSDPDPKSEISLIDEISETFNTLKIEQNDDQPSLEGKSDISAEAEKTVPKEDTISVNSIELNNGIPENLTRSGSVPSLDLKSFLPTQQEEEQQVENMHQLIYWEWKQYMESSVLLLQIAANIFTSITSEVVLKEVLSTARGYNFLCNLAEVAAVCRRVNFSHKEMDINIMGFDDLLMEIDKIWAEMEPFYANVPIVTELPVWPLHQGENTTCALCLTVITSGRVIYNEHSYHATCANLWLNCVNSNLPALYYPNFHQSHSTISLSSSHI